jgi:hypothetical protein
MFYCPSAFSITSGFILDSDVYHFSEPSWPLWEPTGAQIGYHTLFASPLAQKQIIGHHFVK